MHRSALVLFNIAKRRNVGPMIRTANALGTDRIVIVGRKAVQTYGHFGTDRSERRLHFHRLEDALRALRDDGFSICGVEICGSALPIDTHPFAGDTAFLMGNEGEGLSEAQRTACDFLVYIRQYGEAASLNVGVATGIVLHHFGLWADFPESEQRNGKFCKEERR